MTTVDEIGDELDLAFPDLAVELTNAVKIGLLNRAIRAAARSYRLSVWHTLTAAVASGTFEYTIDVAASTNMPENGPAEVWVTRTNMPDLEVTGEVEPYQDSDGTWYLRVGNNFSSVHNTQSIKVFYQSPPQTISAISHTITVPDDFAFNHAAAGFCGRMLSASETAHEGKWTNLLAFYRDEAAEAFKRMPRVLARGPVHGGARSASGG